MFWLHSIDNHGCNYLGHPITNRLCGSNNGKEEVIVDFVKTIKLKVCVHEVCELESKETYKEQYLHSVFLQGLAIDLGYVLVL